MHSPCAANAASFPALCCNKHLMEGLLSCCTALFLPSAAEQTIADMIVYNKSRREARSRLVTRSWERPYLKFKVCTSLQ